MAAQVLNESIGPPYTGSIHSFNHQVPERQVLPRGVDHARDIAILAKDKLESHVIKTLVLDFKNAFMSLPLHQSERRFNCANIPEGVTRTRPPLGPDEPSYGTFVVWQVLGFGGRPNPLLFGRVASVAMRTGQALFDASPKSTREHARGQLYVDDPAVVFCGSPADVNRGIDLLILWWLVLGFPLAWKKGSITDFSDEHLWIGIKYGLDPELQCATMKLPEDYLLELLDLLKPFCSSKGQVLERIAVKMVGKAGRVAQVIPAARPFVGSLWAALTSAQSSKSEAAPGHVAVRRFSSGASWLTAMILGEDDTLLPLVRHVYPSKPSPASASGWSARFDASTTGGGSVLYHGDKAVEFFVIEFNNEMAAHLDIDLAQLQAPDLLGVPGLGADADPVGQGLHPHGVSGPGRQHGFAPRRPRTQGQRTSHGSRQRAVVATVAFELGLRGRPHSDGAQHHRGLPLPSSRTATCCFPYSGTEECYEA